MRLKVLVTGNSERIIENLCEHLRMDRNYITVDCCNRIEILPDIIYRELPDCIMVCLNNENAQSVKQYDVLENFTQTGMISIFVVGREDDRELFKQNTSLQKVFFLDRPVPLLAMYQKMGQIEKELEDMKRRNPNGVEEFVNINQNIESNKKHILVVDDDPNQLVQVKELLKDFYETTLVRSGEAAIKYLRQHKVDLVLLDFLMPEMDGPTVFKEIRSYEKIKDIPVIFLTGMTEKDTVTRIVLKLKPQGYLVKPIKKSELVAKIIDVLG